MITIVSHDSGGAEILSDWALHQKIDFNYVLSGPAVKIFKKKIVKLKISTLEKSIKTTDTIITGSSWPEKIELEAIKLAKKYKIKSITFLDHWEHYKIRFFDKKKYYFPEEIWVGDIFAYKKAKEEFPEIKIIKKTNFYLTEMIKRVGKKKKNIKNILYLCSPIIKKFNKNKYIFKYNEIQLLDYFLTNLKFLKLNYKKIIVRPHPTETKSKYEWIRKKYNFNIEVNKKEKLENQISGSKLIAGLNSNAMVIAVLCGKKVLNVSPAGKRANILPYKSIKNFSDFFKK